MRTELTKRESEVIALVAKGLTDAEIAGRLGIALSTVSMHTRTAYAKLQARNRVEATLSWLRMTGKIMA